MPARDAAKHVTIVNSTKTIIVLCWTWGVEEEEEGEVEELDSFKGLWRNFEFKLWLNAYQYVKLR